MVGADVGGASSASYIDILYLSAFTREMAIWDSNTFWQFVTGYSNDKLNVKYVGHFQNFIRLNRISENGYIIFNSHNSLVYSKHRRHLVLVPRQ